MKIVEETPTRLVVKDSILFFKIIQIILGCAFEVFGLAVIFFLVTSVSFQCQRGDSEPGSCVLVDSALAGKNTRFKASTNQLLGATLEVDTDSDGNEIYRPVLQFTQQTIPLLPDDSRYLPDFRFLFSAKKVQQAVIQVNNFVDKPNETFLRVQVNQYVMTYVIGGGIILMGFVAIYTALKSKITDIWIVDKDEQKLIYKQQYFYNYHQIMKWRFHDIVGVELVVKEDSDGDRSCWIELCLQSSERIPIDFCTDDQFIQRQSYHYQPEKMQEIVFKIRQILD